MVVIAAWNTGNQVSQRADAFPSPSCSGTDSCLQRRWRPTGGSDATPGATDNENGWYRIGRDGMGWDGIVSNGMGSVVRRQI